MTQAGSGIAWVVALSTMFLPLSGCTLLADEEPFRIAVHSNMREPWTGTIVVAEPDGDERLRKTLTITQNSIRTQYHIGELDGEFRFIVESGSLRWEDSKAMSPGKSSWTVTVTAQDVLCYRYSVDGAASDVCPELVEV